MNYQTLLLVLAITFFSANAIAGNERAEYCQKIAFGSHSREEIRDDPKLMGEVTDKFISCIINYTIAHSEYE